MSQQTQREQAFWEPGKDVRPHQDEQPFVDDFREHINRTRGLKLANFWDLHRWSVENTADFWGDVWKHFGTIGDIGKGPYHDPSIPISEPQSWFPGAKFNAAENLLLAHPNARSKTANAVIASVEPDPTAANPREPVEIGRLTYHELYTEVNKAAHALLRLGVKPGDSVVTFAANSCEMVIVFLAVVAVGGIFSSTPAEFGAHAVIDRYSLIKPKVLFTIDQYRYGGKTHSVVQRARQVVDLLTKIGGLQHVVVIGHLALNRKPVQEALRGYAQEVSVRSWQDFMAGSFPSEIPFHRGNFNDPMWIVFSSGTTGKPKAIYGPAGGIILMRRVTFKLHMNLDHRDSNLQFTTMGWIVWNLHILFLATGGTVLLYDGSPFHPQQTLWRLAEKYKATQLGASPRYIQTLARNGFEPRQGRDLSHLKQLFLTGAPITPDVYDFVRQKLGRLLLNNNAGGTELGGSALHSNPVLPIYKGELQAPVLGMDVIAVSSDGKPIVGKEGTMVFRTAFPNMPTGFVGDTDRSLLKKTYFADFPQPYFNMNDSILVNQRTKGVTILGRADGILNPNGVRMGSSELYHIIEQHFSQEVEDCLAVGQRQANGSERVIMFLKPTLSSAITPQLEAKIRKAIATALTRRHVPEVITACPGVPVTMSGFSKIEASVKKILSGVPASQVSAIGVQNPEVFQFYQQWVEKANGRRSKL